MASINGPYKGGVDGKQLFRKKRCGDPSRQHAEKKPTMSLCNKAGQAHPGLY